MEALFGRQLQQLHFGINLDKGGEAKGVKVLRRVDHRIVGDKDMYIRQRPSSRGEDTHMQPDWKGWEGER